LIDSLIDFLVFNATFSNISAISWRPVLVVEEAGQNHRPWASNWSTLGNSHYLPGGGGWTICDTSHLRKK